jgi:hypothetical protein
MQDVKEQFIAFWKDSGGEKIFKVRGTSMLPLIRETYSVGVLPLRESGELRIGDIALFQSPTGMVAHRIVGKIMKDKRTYLLEKGDTAIAPKLIASELVIGKVVRIYRPGSTINLNSRFWIFVNCSTGYYWHYLYSASQILYMVKQKLFGTSKFPRIAAAYQKTYRFLCALPSHLFRHK